MVLLEVAAKNHDCILGENRLVLLLQRVRDRERERERERER